MKKILSGFRKNLVWFLVLSFYSGITMAAQVEVEGTGVDWEESTMQVEFTAENSEVPAFSCFAISPDNCVGTKDHCVVEDLDTLGYSDENSAPVIDNCFHQAGEYTVTITLKDFAENTSDPVVSNFTVKAGTPNQDQSEFSVSGCQTTGESGVNIANGTDICTFIFKVKDKYGNPVTQLAGKNAQIYSDSDYPLDANRGVSFRDGLRLSGLGAIGTSSTPTTFTLSNDATVSKQFQLSAWAPSTSEVVAHLGKNEAKQLDLNIELFTIDANGNLDMGNTVTFQYGQYSPDVRFRPPAKTLLSLLNNSEFIVDVPTPMKLFRSLTPANPGGTAGPPVKTFLRTYLHYHNLPTALSFTAASQAFFKDNPTPNTQRDPSGETYIRNLELTLTGPDPKFSHDLSFSTEVEYDTPIGIIRYPSGALGSGFGVTAGEVDDLNDDSIGTRMIGVSIEGDVLSSKTSQQTFSDTEHLLLGGLNFKDAREVLSQNAASITRGIPVQLGGQFDTNWYNNSHVAVVDGDVEIGFNGGTFNLPAGKNTLVIRNGNLLISGDLAYASESDSFGFILINDAIDPYPEKGNIFVRNRVKNIVGTYFAEGGFMSIADAVSFNSISVAANNNGSLPLTAANQLLLKGTLMTHNTVGGSLFPSTYSNPWGVEGETNGTTTETHAKTYDLHFVRQFQPLYPAGGGSMTNEADCFSTPCDRNLNAFVIRVDGKVSSLPPPGFETLATIKR